jgi:uncharacterized protein (TIGR02001 family)
MLVGLALLSARAAAADVWGGSLAFGTDYLVRGVSRTNDHGAAQMELHYLNSNGLLAGVFVSNSQFSSGREVDAELSAFLGYGVRIAPDWRVKSVYSHYAYPGDPGGSNYSYDELDVALSFRDWLALSVNYSPNSPRFVPFPYPELLSVAEKSLELNLQRPLFEKLSATAGVGCSHLNGPGGASYVYWSVGAAYALGPVSLAVSYADTSPAAKALFYNEAATGRFTGTVIWRF